MGILRDLIGGAVQQGMTSRVSNQRTDDQQYQPYQPDHVQQPPRQGYKRDRRGARARVSDLRQSSDQGYIGGQQIAQLPRSALPLPPRQAVASYSSARVYRSVLPSEGLTVSNQGYLAVDGHDSSQSKGYPPAPLSYPDSRLGLPGYEEEDRELDGGDGWYGLSVPVALPQTGYGQGVPFLRAYSDQLEDAGIPQRIFVEFLDALNVTVVPNPETQIANKAAGLAGWFVPGVGGIALGLVQVGAQVGGAMHLKQATASCLQSANKSIFAPVGLEVLICKSRDIDDTVGCLNSFATNPPPGAGYIDKLLSYGSLIAPLTSLPPVNVGRSDLLAQLGAGLSSRSQQKTQKKAAKDMASGKMQMTNAMEASFNWVLIRNISA